MDWTVMSASCAWCSAKCTASTVPSNSAAMRAARRNDISASGPPSEIARMDLYKIPRPLCVPRLLPLPETFFHGTMTTVRTLGSVAGVLGWVSGAHAIQSNAAVRNAGRSGVEVRGVVGRCGARSVGEWVPRRQSTAPGSAPAANGRPAPTGAPAPVVPDGTATFTNNGAPTAVTISNSTSIDTIAFTAAAPAYSFTVTNGASFAINNTISNSSSSLPNFAVNTGATLTIGDTADVADRIAHQRDGRWRHRRHRSDRSLGLPDREPRGQHDLLRVVLGRGLAASSPTPRRRSPSPAQATAATSARSAAISRCATASAAD